MSEYRLEDVPDMNYLSSNNQGEILIRGSCVTPGYFRNPALTAETIKNGWLHTGDIGTILASGALKIIDRKKHLFKLSQGEFIAPEKLETIYGHHPLVNQIFVYGESTKSYLIAIVFPENETVFKWVEDNEIYGDAKEIPPFEEIISQTKFKEYLLGELHVLAKTEKLNGLESI